MHLSRLPFELFVGLRYVRARRTANKNGFISFISLASVIGIALGVSALIIVLSVMNGFQREVRDRMLSVIAHVEVMSYVGGALPDWQAAAAKARENPAVAGAARTFASVLRQSGSALPLAAVTSTCAMTESMRSCTSLRKPFITESTMISAATPNPMPSMDTPEMKEMKPLRRPARPARV